MILIELGIIILLVGLVIALAMKFFWLVSIIFLYRFISYFITFEWIKETFGLENHLIYFIVVLAIVFIIHYLLIRLTYELEWLRYTILVLVVTWVFFHYDFLEIFLVKDWLIANGLWGEEGFRSNLKELFSTSPEQFKGYFMGALNTLNEFFDSIMSYLLK